MQQPEHVSLGTKVALLGGTDLLRSLVELLEAGYLDEAEESLATLLRVIEAVGQQVEDDDSSEEPEADDAPATIVDYRKAREFYAERIEERSKLRAEQVEAEEKERLRELARRSKRETRKWLSDLETWPEPFQDALEERVRRICSAETLGELYASDTPERLVRRRAREESYSRFDMPEWCVLDALQKLHAAAQARFDPEPDPRSRKRTPAGRLRDAQDAFLFELWSWGYRTVPWAELEGFVDEYVRGRIESLERYINGLEKELAKTTAKLEANVSLKGPRKGKPYAETTRRAFQRRVDVIPPKIESAQEQLRKIRAEHDTMEAFRLCR